MSEFKPEIIHPFVTCAWDIETTGLDGSYGRLLCCSFKFSNEDKVRTVRCRLLKEEKKALMKVREILMEPDIWLTWNGKMFDVRFMNARLLHHDLPPLPEKWHIDLMWQHKKLRTRGHRLEGAGKDLKLHTLKHDVSAAGWISAAEDTGPVGKQMFDEIVRHCEHDVVMTEQAFVKLKPLIVRITK